MCLFAFCAVTVNPRVPRAREAGTPPPRGHCGGVTQQRLLHSLGTGVTLNPYGLVGHEQIPTDPRGMERIRTDPGGTEWSTLDPSTLWDPL